MCDHQLLQQTTSRLLIICEAHHHQKLVVVWVTDFLVFFSVYEKVYSFSLVQTLGVITSRVTTVFSNTAVAFSLFSGNNSCKSLIGCSWMWATAVWALVQGEAKIAGGLSRALHSAVSELFNHGMVYTTNLFGFFPCFLSLLLQALCALFTNANRAIWTYRNRVAKECCHVHHRSGDKGS